MRKHLAWYIADLPGSKELRTHVFGADTYAQVEAVLLRFAELEVAAPERGALAFAGLTCDPASLEPEPAREVAGEAV